MEILSNLIHGTTALVSIKTVTFLMFCVFAVLLVPFAVKFSAKKGSEGSAQSADADTEIEQ